MITLPAHSRWLKARLKTEFHLTFSFSFSFIVVVLHHLHHHRRHPHHQLAPRQHASNHSAPSDVQSRAWRMQLPQASRRQENNGRRRHLCLVHPVCINLTQSSAPLFSSFLNWPGVAGAVRCPSFVVVCSPWPLSSEHTSTSALTRMLRESIWCRSHWFKTSLVQVLSSSVRVRVCVISSETRCGAACFGPGLCWSRRSDPPCADVRVISPQTLFGAPCAGPRVRLFSVRPCM